MSEFLEHISCYFETSDLFCRVISYTEFLNVKLFRQVEMQYK